MTVIATDTTSYPNMHLETVADDNGNIAMYHLRPNDGYVIHNHATCDPAAPELGIPATCWYLLWVTLPPAIDLATINDNYVAVLRSSVPAENIMGDTNKPEVM